MRQMRIGRMGRTVPVGTTTAMAVDVLLPDHIRDPSEDPLIAVDLATPTSHQRASSAAQCSLERLLAGTGFARS